MFAPLLEQFLQYTKSQAMVSNTYQILLLLTDGVIHDMPRTKELVVELSALPCSIIIIGVGGANFDEMEELDGDGERLRDRNGREIRRDVV